MTKLCDDEVVTEEQLKDKRWNIFVNIQTEEQLKDRLERVNGLIIKLRTACVESPCVGMNTWNCDECQIGMGTITYLISKRQEIELELSKLKERKEKKEAIVSWIGQRKDGSFVIATSREEYEQRIRDNGQVLLFAQSFGNGKVKIYRTGVWGDLVE